MLTWLLNSKKCLIASSPALLLSLCAHAAIAPATAPAQVIQQIKQDLNHRNSTQFSALISKWKNSYGTRAVAPLLSLAKNSSESDPNRYIAVMAAARLGGAATADSIALLSKDSCWMVRLASLRALSGLHPTPLSPQVSQAILARATDPALVIRSDAIDAIQILKPAGSREVLLKAVADPANYHHGKAQWVPQKALVALEGMAGPDLAPRLAFLLDHRDDPALQKQALHTLHALTGKEISSSLPLAEQIQRWKLALAK